MASDLSGSDKVIVVCGVNGHLGQAIAEAFLAHGMFVAGIGRQPSVSIEPSASVLGRFSYFRADVCDAAQVDIAFENIVKRYGRINVLFYVAVSYRESDFIEEHHQDWFSTIDTNINGLAYCCKAALRSMLRLSSGRIYAAGSFADIKPLFGQGAYATSRAAVHALVRSVAVDLEKRQSNVQIHEWIPTHTQNEELSAIGIDLTRSASNALNLVLQDDASRNGSLFEGEREWHTELGLKQRVLRRLGLRR